MGFTVHIKFKRIHPKAVIPEAMTPGAACVDLVATEIEYIDENKVLLKYGFCSEIPQGYKIAIQPRSSFTHKSWILANSPCQVDSDYRGEWMGKFEAIPIGINKETGTFIYEEFPYKPGDRVAQASIEVAIAMRFAEVEDLSMTLRGAGGYGSTGT